MVESIKSSTSRSERPQGWSVPVHREPDPPVGGLLQVLRMPAVVAATGLSRTTLWRLRQTGEFPAPVRLGGDGSRAVGWLRSDIEAWIRSRPAA
ncbi:MAG: AlpA family phage regulatory protein [Acidimicrobiia bacterium]|nr:AlpA family phage regulatory protein [Acidimicrobiia bacterium]